MRQPPKQTYKALLWDYDILSALSDDECCYSLSEREVAILLAGIDYIRWKTRYMPTSTVIDQGVIDAWEGNLARKLMSGCCPDDEKLTRFTSEGVWEVSTDGGETWHTEPGTDPRNDGTFLPPLPGSGDMVKCAAADNARDQFKAIRDTLISLLEGGTTVLAIIAGIMGAIGVLLGISVVGTVLGVLLVSLATALLASTPESVEEDLSDAVMDEFRCILFCNVGSNGQFSYDQWLAVLAEVDTTFGGFAHTFFHGIVAAMGYIGLSNAGTVGVTTAEDCGECDCGGEWCYYFDFTLGEHSWIINTDPVDFGRYTSGVGFQQNMDFDPVDAIEIYRTFATRTITSVTVYANPTFTGAAPRAILYKGDFLADSIIYDGAWDQHTYELTDSLSRISFDFDPRSGGAGEWTGAISAIKITGLGTNPFGEDNCPEE